MKLRRRGALAVVLLIGTITPALPAGAKSAPPPPEGEKAQFEQADATLTNPNPFKEAGDGVYIVRLADAPLATYDGSINGLAATSPETTGEAKLLVEQPASVEYQQYLEGAHGDFVNRLGSTLGHAPDLRFEYFNASNGFAVWLTSDEAARVARMPGVGSVVKQQTHTIDTDHGPAWIGAPSLWDGSATGGVGSQGEGIVIGVLDTGINPSNPSFADVGDDGYDHTNPLGAGNYVGVCNEAEASYDPSFPCNDKLIGAWSFVSSPNPIDDDGHGSHTASTAGGNVTDATVVGPTLSVDTRISGVAPHANIISYDVCPNTCEGAAILAAIDQAIADGVDVINYSIGSETPTDPWSSADDLGFLAARAAGIFVAHSAGNEGPGVATVGSPMAPWITHVAATTHDRKYVNSVIDLTGGATTPPADMHGAGFTSGYGPAEIVYAANYPSTETDNPAFCGAGAQLDFNSPWPEGTFNGEIVVCDRGVYGRVEKGANVLAAGAGGMILVDDGSGLSGDAHELPAVHITAADGTILKAWLADGGTGHTGSISGASASIADANADIMAGFSSRGPNRATNGATIAPSVAAPGVDIIAANGVGDEVSWGFISGTSMASPHVAGSAALLTALHPDWTPAMIESALMTTGVTSVVKEDGVTPADVFDIGGGRVDLVAATNAALVLDESTADYEAADPAAGGDPTQLNLASLADAQCVVNCSWTRTLTNPADSGVTVAWTASGSASGGVTVSVAPTDFTLAPGESIDVTITAEVSAAEADTYHFGEVVFANTAGRPNARLPLAVQPVTGSLPEMVEITTRRNHGSWDVDGLEALEITDLTVTANGLVEAALRTEDMVQDPTNGSIYDNQDNGVFVELVQVADGATDLIAEITESEALDVDLFVGLDANGDGIAEEAEEVCRSASPTAFEKCVVADPAAGQYWILVQNWEASVEGEPDLITLASAVLPGTDAGNMTVEGPETVPQLTPFSVSVFWDLPDAAAGDVYYGAFSLGTDAANPGNIGTVPVVLRRLADDVTKVADVASASPGDTVTYTVTVEPNVTNADLTYNISDAIPEGMTYVEGSATGGAVHTDGVIQWSGVMPSPALAERFYEMSTPATDPTCDTGFGGYVDLEQFGIFPQSAISGDTSVWTFTTAQQFYGVDYSAMGVTDDGFAIFDPASNYGGSPWNAQMIPDPALPNNVAAMYWHDFEIVYDAATNAGVSAANAGPTFVVEYDDVRAFGGDTSLMDFQIVVNPVTDVGPEIVFAYDNVATTPGPATIGVENAAGDAAVAYANLENPPAIASGDVVCFDWTSPQFDPATFSYQVTVDDDAPAGPATNVATHITDNPGDEAATASATVEILPLAPTEVLQGIVDDLNALLADPPDGTSRQDLRRLQKAVDFIEKSLDDRYWDDAETLDRRHGTAVFVYHSIAAAQLERIGESSPVYAAAQEALADLVATDADLAKAARAAAAERGVPTVILRLVDRFIAIGDAAAAHGEPATALILYGQAWTLAQWGR